MSLATKIPRNPDYLDKLEKHWKKVQPREGAKLLKLNKIVLNHINFPRISSGFLIKGFYSLKDPGSDTALQWGFVHL